MAEKMDHQGFVSREYTTGKRMRSRYFDRQGYAYAHRSRENTNNSSSMLAKIGICGMLCALVVLVNHFNSQNVLSAAAMEAYDEEMGGDYLGKLRFVELPGIIQVFSSEAKLKIGVESKEYEITEDDTLLVLYGCAEQSVAVPADGEVKSINKSGEHYVVEIALSNDIVISYGNVQAVKVEEGQPLKKGDTLFETRDTLEIKVYLKGRPEVPSEYFDISEMQSA